MLGKGKGKERFIEVEIKKGKKVNNQRSKICFVHSILSRIVPIYIHTPEGYSFSQKLYGINVQNLPTPPRTTP